MAGVHQNTVRGYEMGWQIKETTRAKLATALTAPGAPEKRMKAVEAPAVPGGSLVQPESELIVSALAPDSRANP